MQEGEGAGWGLFSKYTTPYLHICNKQCVLLVIVCKSILDLHGSSLHLSSEGEGLGSTFTVLLPRLTSVHVDNTLFDPPTAIRIPSPSNTRNMESAFPLQPIQKCAQACLSSLRSSLIGNRRKAQTRTMGTSHEWNLPVTMGQVKPLASSNRLNKLLNVEVTGGKSVTTDVTWNESKELVRPFPSANMREDSSNVSSSALNDDGRDLKSCSTIDVRALGAQTINQIISDTPEHRYNDGKLCHQIIGIAFESAKPHCLTRVLIVDDVAMNRKMLRRVLETRFDVIDEADDGQKAVEIISKSLEGGDPSFYNVITIDYQMPVMDGVTATKRIRSMGFSGKIIAVTGNALEEDVLTFKASGVDAVLMKPLDIRRFDAIVRADVGESK